MRITTSSSLWLPAVVLVLALTSHAETPTVRRDRLRSTPPAAEPAQVPRATPPSSREPAAVKPEAATNPAAGRDPLRAPKLKPTASSPGPDAQVHHRIILETASPWVPDTAVGILARNPGAFATPAAQVRVSCVLVETNTAFNDGIAEIPETCGGLVFGGQMFDVPPLGAGASAHIYQIQVPGEPFLGFENPFSEKVPHWTFEPVGIAGAPLILE